MLEGEEGAVLLLGDRDHGLAGKIAAEDEDVGTVEFRAVDELLEADIRAVKVGGEEDLHLPVAALVLLAPKHRGTPVLQNFVR